MGTYFADQYSLLHFCVGAIAFFWNVPFVWGFLAHFVFEILENTEWGVRAINRYIIDPGFFSWPGEKHHPDAAINIAGDNTFFAVGWWVARGLDAVGRRRKWFV